MSNMENTENTMSRGEFIKKAAIGAVVVGVGLKTGGPIKALAGENKDAVHKGATPPSDKKKLWLDTSNGGAVTKYWDGKAWTATDSTWG